MQRVLRQKHWTETLTDKSALLLSQRMDRAMRSFTFTVVLPGDVVKPRPDMLVAGNKLHVWTRLYAGEK